MNIQNTFKVIKKNLNLANQAGQSALKKQKIDFKITHINRFKLTSSGDHASFGYYLNIAIANFIRFLNSQKMTQEEIEKGHMILKSLRYCKTEYKITSIAITEIELYEKAFLEKGKDN